MIYRNRGLFLGLVLGLGLGLVQPVQSSLPWGDEICTESRLSGLEQRSESLTALSIWMLYYYSSDKTISDMAARQLATYVQGTDLALPYQAVSQAWNRVLDEWVASEGQPTPKLIARNTEYKLAYHAFMRVLLDGTTRSRPCREGVS